MVTVVLSAHSHMLREGAGLPRPLLLTPCYLQMGVRDRRIRAEYTSLLRMRLRLHPPLWKVYTLYHALLTVVFCLFVSIIRISSLCKPTIVIIVVFLSVFVSYSAPFLPFYSFSERWCKPESRLRYILESRLRENRTFLVILSIQFVSV